MTELEVKLPNVEVKVKIDEELTVDLVRMISDIKNIFTPQTVLDEKFTQPKDANGHIPYTEHCIDEIEKEAKDAS
jgi:hypothetical protein